MRYVVKNLRETRIYQEIKEEILEEMYRKAKQKVEIESIPRLLAFGLTLEQIAYALDTSVELVRQVVQKHESGS